MKISVVTPVYNGEKYIRQTVESVLSQSGDFELEYIICDGQSTDGTLKILEEFKDRCTIISRKDGSAQAAINYGMAMATGEIGCWLNADDVFEPGTLQTVATAFQQHPESRWLYGRCRIIDENGREIRKPITAYKNILGYCYSKYVLLCENFINQPATFWRMDLWRETGHLDNKYRAAWDYELWLFMAEKSRPVHLRKLLASFRRHDDSISNNHFERQFQEELAICREHGNVLTSFIHMLNVWKIVWIYKLLSRTGNKNK
jgi:glycosyltransferase involved in cell wall biosynthesis